MADTYQRLTHHPTNAKRERYVEEDETIISLRDENPGITKAQQVLQYVIGVVSGLLLVRFLFALFGANAGNSFVNIIYDLTGPLVRPFRNLFTVEAAAGVARFEIETLIATITYILIGLAINRLLDVFRDTA